MAYEDGYWNQFEDAPPPDGAIYGSPREITPPGTPGSNPGPLSPPRPGAPAPTTSGGMWDEARFTSQFGRPGTPQELLALEAQLNAAGIQVLRNAAGVAGKIQLPNGQIIDVINAAGAGGRGFQWLTGDGGSGSGMGGADGFGAWTAPYTGQYTLPTLEELQHMPGYQAGLDAYRKGVESSAAAKGTLLTPGTVQRLGQAGADYAAQSYGQLANLGLGAFNTNYNIYRNNQNDPFNKFYDLARLGQG